MKVMQQVCQLDFLGMISYKRGREMVSPRQQHIFETILYASQFVTLEDLMLLTNKSERTVQYDIAHLRSFLEGHHIEIRFVSTKGFYIPINQRVRGEMVLNQIVSQSDTSKSTNQAVIFELFLLLMLNKPLTMTQLTQIMFMSERKLSECFQQLTQFLPEQLVIEHKRQIGYTISGPEYLVRQTMMQALDYFIEASAYVERWHNVVPISIKPYLKPAVLEQLETHFKRCNLTYRVWLTSEMFYQMLLYLLVSTLRKNFSLEYQHDFDFVPPNRNTLDYLFELLKIEDDTPMAEIQYGLSMLSALNIMVKQQELNNVHLDELLEAIKTLLLQEQTDFYLDELLQDLQLHFQTLIYQQPIINDGARHILANIRTQYADYYAIAEKIALLFETKFKTLSEEEISFITIYLYKNRRETTARKRVIVVCATGKGLSTLLVARIQSVFPEIEIVETKSYYHVEYLDTLQNIDFIITTLPLEQTNVPYVRISNALSNADIRKIRQKVSPQWSTLPSPELQLPDNNLLLDQALMQAYSSLIGQIMLTFINLMGEVQARYELSYDNILGLIIHIIMAIPRWYEKESHEPDFDEHLLLAIEVKYPDLEQMIASFFEYLEEALMVKIARSEQYAFYQYILRNEVHNDK